MGNLPWLNVLHVYCHTLLLGKVCTVYASTRGGQLEALSMELFWTLPYVSLPSTDFNLYLIFAVIDHCHEYNAFFDSCESFKQTIRPEGGLGTSELAVAVINEGGLGDSKTLQIVKSLRPKISSSLIHAFPFLKYTYPRR